MPCLSHGENTHHQQLTDLLAIETRGGENCVETGGVRRSMAGEGEEASREGQIVSIKLSSELTTNS